MHSIGSISARRTTMERPARSANPPALAGGLIETKLLGVSSVVCSSQNAVMAVSSRPLSGLGPSITTSNAYIRTVEVLEHAMAINRHALDEAATPHQEVVGQDAAVGEDDALHRAVGDVALVPQGDVLQPGAEVTPQNPGQAAHLLGLDGVALV